MTWRKSTHSQTSNCVEVDTTWQKSSAGVRVRDSKNPDGPVLTFGRDEWVAFLAGVRSGEFDPPRA